MLGKGPGIRLVGATVLALGFEIFKGWVASNPEYDSVSNNEQIKQGDSRPKTQNHL